MIREASGFYETYSVIEKYCKEKNVWVPDRIVNGSVNRKKEKTAESRITDLGKPSENGYG